LSGGPGVKPRMFVKVPPDRMGVVIGEGGKVKQEIMRRTGTLLTVDTDNGVVVIEAETPSTGPVNVMKAAEVVKAIAYGFTPEKAFKLLDDDYVLVLIDLKSRVGDSPNHLKRVKGRIIGEGGRARRTLEQMTGADIVVGDTHVAVIGEYERAMVAKEAIDMLIDGRMHSTVYRHVDKLMREVRRRESLRLWTERL